MQVESCLKHLFLIKRKLDSNLFLSIHLGNTARQLKSSATMTTRAIVCSPLRTSSSAFYRFHWDKSRQNKSFRVIIITALIMKHFPMEWTKYAEEGWAIRWDFIRFKYLIRDLLGFAKLCSVQCYRCSQQSYEIIK